MASRQHPSSDSSASYKPGDIISSTRSNDEFVIDEVIGKGSFAQVFRARHKESNKAVAVKSVRLKSLNKKLRENLNLEVNILFTLRHPHIVALHACINSRHYMNLIMEYCELNDLSILIKKRRQLSEHPATRDMVRKYPNPHQSGLNEVVIRHFLQQLSSALEFLRSKNYIHRDIKPQNLLLLPSQSLQHQQSVAIMKASQDSLIPTSGIASLPMLKLADFGFARELSDVDQAETLCGSPLYMAPEILGHEQYDAKADLWSVGTVLYEMITGKPPFRAVNYVELLRKIKLANDEISFPSTTVVSDELKELVRSLLKQKAVERLSFDKLFTNPIVAGDIPDLVENDTTKPISREPVAAQTQKQSASPRPSSRRLPNQDTGRSSRPNRAEYSSSPSRSSPRRPSDPANITRPSRDVEGLGIQRGSPQYASSLPTHLRDAKAASRELAAVTERGQLTDGKELTNSERAAQDVMFERDYVIVERRHVEVNALADELAANERLATERATSPRPGLQVARRSTASGAIPTPTSRTALIAQGHGHDRRASYEKSLSVSPSSASNPIQAVQDASLRFFGYKINPLRSKGQSPPTYRPFPAYPTPSTATNLLSDGKSTSEDVIAAQTIEDFATRSDCVYGFAEVKYKQLVPMAPSTDFGLGGIDAEQLSNDEDGLTLDAIVALSEEALVLYVKSLTLLARAMDIASVWWSTKRRTDATPSGLTATATQRINAVVQWVRQRFNEVLEKSEIVRVKLVEAQKLLPEEHPSHPSNQAADSLVASEVSGFKQVYLTPGISAEKLMYDRAVEMSRAAAIDEVTNENLPGCEITYITAIRMLEAVLDNNEAPVSRRSSTSKERAKDVEKPSTDLDTDEEAHVRKMITMITGRLGSVRRKQKMIEEANRQAQTHGQGRRMSGDATPRSVRSNGST